ncbi:MAG: hypothetical protein ACWA5X_01100 [bacterium]
MIKWHIGALVLLVEGVGFSSPTLAAQGGGVDLFVPEDYSPYEANQRPQYSPTVIPPSFVSTPPPYGYETPLWVPGSQVFGMGFPSQALGGGYPVMPNLFPPMGGRGYNPLMLPGFGGMGFPY